MSPKWRMDTRLDESRTEGKEIQEKRQDVERMNLLVSSQIDKREEETKFERKIFGRKEEKRRMKEISHCTTGCAKKKGGNPKVKNKRMEKKDVERKKLLVLLQKDM